MEKKGLIQNILEGTCPERVKRVEGFTLIEIMIVITILGVLAALISGNLLSSLKKGRDAKRKADLEQVQKALEMYYEDNTAYPASITFGDAFVNGSKRYMEKLPQDPVAANRYRYVPSADGSSYKLYACLENTQDQGAGVSMTTGYTINGTNCGSCQRWDSTNKRSVSNGTICNFGISSSNTTVD